MRVQYEEESATFRLHVKPPLSEPTPDYSPRSQSLEQVSRTGPVLVTSHESVARAALEAAGTMLGEMLRNRGDLAFQLRSVGTLTAVIGRHESLCDLSYFEIYTGSSLCDLEGLGGNLSYPITACEERNLLADPGDPYQRGSLIGQNICVHELSHTIMDAAVDTTTRAAIVRRYVEAYREGKWDGTYAITNEQEFFAVTSQIYFCATSTFNFPYINCAAQLEQYDPRTYQLLHSIYRGAVDLR